jgi:hypothetical protein
MMPSAVAASEDEGQRQQNRIMKKAANVAHTLSLTVHRNGTKLRLIIGTKYKEIEKIESRKRRQMQSTDTTSNGRSKLKY